MAAKSYEWGDPPMSMGEASRMLEDARDTPIESEQPIINARSVGRVECGNENGLDWTAVYIIHTDQSQGWQITFDHGRTWTPREELPSG